MVKISILYPITANARFDIDYYLKVHAPFAISRLGSAIISFTIDTGTHSPLFPDPLYVAAGHYLCSTSEEFMTAYLPHAAELQADVANYTDIEPFIQVSQVHAVFPGPS